MTQPMRSMLGVACLAAVLATQDRSFTPSNRTRPPAGTPPMSWPRAPSRAALPSARSPSTAMYRFTVDPTGPFQVTGCDAAS